jgi:hypothetical protein
MATQISKVVDSGGTGDWTTLNAALVANFGASGLDLVSQDENVLNTLINTNGGNLVNSYLIINGFNTDATRKLTFEVPKSFKHNAVYPVTGNVSHMTYLGDSMLSIYDDNVTVRDCVIVSKGTSGWPSALLIDSNNALLERCIIVCDDRFSGSPGETYTVHYDLGAGETATLRNCIILNLDSGSGTARYGIYQGNTTTGGTLILENCLIYSIDRGVYTRVADGLEMKNCVVVTEYDYEVGIPGNLTAASTNNAWADAAADIDLTDIPLSSIFRDAASFDWRLTENSILRWAGVNLTGDGVVDDILDNPRPDTGYFDVGPHQFGSSSTARPVYVIRKNVTTGKSNVDKVTLLVAEGPNEATVRDIANSRVAGDSSWDDAEIEEVVSAWDYAGLKISVSVGGQHIAEYTAGVGDTMDDIGSAFPDLINGNGGIENASWSSGTLTVADVDDEKGDLSLEVFVLLPGTEEVSSNPEGSIVGDIVDKGIVESALTVELLDVGLPRIIERA